jgi:hypothetical protein
MIRTSTRTLADIFQRIDSRGCLHSIELDLTNANSLLPRSKRINILMVLPVSFMQINEARTSPIQDCKVNIEETLVIQLVNSADAYVEAIRS